MKKYELEFSHRDFETLSRSLSDFWGQAIDEGLESKAVAYLQANSAGKAMTKVFANIGNRYCECEWSKFDHHSHIPFPTQDELRVFDPHAVYDLLYDMDDWCDENGHEILTVSLVYKTLRGVYHEVVGLKFKTQTEDWFWEHTYTL